MKNIIPILLIALACNSFAQQGISTSWNSKNKYDVFSHANAENKPTKGILRDSINNTSLSATMLQGGYFTIGTIKGKSISIKDDYCQITYGHPYSMTSFPFVRIDGETITPITILSATSPINNNDTLLFNYSQGKINISYKLFFVSDFSLAIKIEVINADLIEHQIGAGYLFDAAIGKWGDGYTYVNGQAVDTKTDLTVIPDSITIWERNTNPKGIGISLDFDKQNKPNQISIANWNDLYTKTQTSDEIYDLGIQLNWNDDTVTTLSKKEYQFNIKLIEPELPGDIFMRWDVPSALTIQDQQLFPINMTPLIEIYSNDSTAAEYKLKVEGSYAVDTWDQTIAFALHSGVVNQISQINVNEVYSSIIEEVSISLMKGITVLDKLTKKIYIPASPFSNSGLQVDIDSMYTLNGVVFVRFSSMVESSGKMIYNLKNTNVKYLLNNQPITDLTIEKSNTAGTKNTDIVFVLDVTGSMSEEINAVKSNIIEFADSLSERGFDYRLALVTFRDEVTSVFDFTANANEFKGYVGLQSADGGDDRAENSLEALVSATKLNYRANSSRTIIWITDADYHIKDSFTTLTVEATIDELLKTGVRVNTIGAEEFQTDFYDQINLNTGGKFYDINGNFRDILLDVTRAPQSYKYLISFKPLITLTTSDTLKIEVHYAGLGGADSIKVNGSKAMDDINEPIINTYPNPVNEQSKIKISNVVNGSCIAEVYNLNGQRINVKNFESAGNEINIPILDILSNQSATEFYVIHLSIYDKSGLQTYSQTLTIFNK